MAVYIVVVTPEAALAKVSQTGYRTLEEAQAFVLSRNARRRTDYLFYDDDYTRYEIAVVTI